ncbi:hypothetical protein HG530_006054 [Fusarium avenaceum]|nr:hypothetical protein HG530_006054 [Fusarium avenaceum]
MGLAHDLLNDAVALARLFAAGGCGHVDLLGETFSLPILSKTSIAIVEEEIPLSIEGLPTQRVALKIRTRILEEIMSENGEKKDNLGVLRSHLMPITWKRGCADEGLWPLRNQWWVCILQTSLVATGTITARAAAFSVFASASTSLSTSTAAASLAIIIIIGGHVVFRVTLSILNTTRTRLPLFLIVISNTCVFSYYNLLDVAVKPAAVHRLVANNLEISRDLLKVEKLDIRERSLYRNGTGRLEGVRCNVDEFVIAANIQFLDGAVLVNLQVPLDRLEFGERDFFKSRVALDAEALVRVVSVDSVHSVELQILNLGLGDPHHRANLDILLVLN